MKFLVRSSDFRYYSGNALDLTIYRIKAKLFKDKGEALHMANQLSLFYGKLFKVEEK